MAAGRAIVAPGSANVRELLVHGETALLCPGGANPAAGDLGAAVLALARDPALRARLGAAARASLLERGYLWEENARRVEELVTAATRRPAAAVAVSSGEPNGEVTPC
jgi:glycosyltransferase involved in cell wall biosynthesis